MTRSFCLIILAAAIMVVGLCRPAAAVAPFYIEFKKAYLDPHPDKEYAAAVNKAADRCFVCHQGKNRKHHNAFGIHLVELLDKKTDLRDKTKKPISATRKRSTPRSRKSWRCTLIPKTTRARPIWIASRPANGLAANCPISKKSRPKSQPSRRHNKSCWSLVVSR
jgi:hypothetical protein